MEVLVGLIYLVCKFEWLAIEESMTLKKVHNKWLCRVSSFCNFVSSSKKVKLWKNEKLNFSLLLPSLGHRGRLAFGCQPSVKPYHHIRTGIIDKLILLILC